MSSIISKVPGTDQPDKVRVIYELGVALRRVLIVVDKRKSAARNARHALAQADDVLRRDQEPRS
jgi:hypothetical protein